MCISKCEWLRSEFRAAIQSLLDCVKPERERTFERDLARRVAMDNETFCRTYYGDPDIPKEIPIRLRKLFSHQLGQHRERLAPTDKPTDVYDDLDLYELLVEVQDEFGVRMSNQELSQLDGSFDSIVRLLAAKWPTHYDR